VKECIAIFNECINRMANLNNCTIYLELSSQMSHSEFEQLPEPKLQLSQINQFLIEQQPQ